MFTRFQIGNFKSLADAELELGLFNVFIGENGSGKTNVLEAVGMFAAAVTNRLTTEDLFARGIRVARHNLMAGSFPDSEADGHVTVRATFSSAVGEERRYTHLLGPAEDGGFGWAKVRRKAIAGARADISVILRRKAMREAIADFGIYSPSTQSLRGLETSSRREPMGLFGENLDVAIAGLQEQDRQLLHHLARLIDWVDEIQVEESDERKLEGLKIGRSVSRLYFTDRYMREDNRTFSAENANEGILHVLFHLALFLSPTTPRVFAIDNLETALNPGMCRRLTHVLANLAIEREKQALVTTHNPAILDGLNLYDDNQRLFSVYRDEVGHTKIRRIRLKPEAPPGMKLSELWMRGHLGALSQGF